MNELNRQIEVLDAKKAELQQMIQHHGQHDARLRELRTERLHALAEALAAGTPAPSTIKIDKEIAEQEKARTQAVDQAEVATAAIASIESSKKAVRAEINALCAKVRDDTIAAIDTECRESLEQAESILAKLLATLAVLPKSQAPVAKVFQGNREGAPVIDTRSHRLDADLLSQLKAKLLFVGAVGNAQYAAFTTRYNLDAFNRVLSSLAQQLIFARRERDIEAPEWTMGVLKVDPAPIVERLRSVGVQVV